MDSIYICSDLEAGNETALVETPGFEQADIETSIFNGDTSEVEMFDESKRQQQCTTFRHQWETPKKPYKADFSQVFQ